MSDLPQCPSSNGSAALLPCPFCGKQPDLKDFDTLYPSGTLWRDNPELGMRTYHGWGERKDSDGACYSMNCPTQAGGCGAEVHGDSREEAMAAWNRRSVVVSESTDRFPALTARLRALEEAARIVERHMGPIETYNPGYRDWMKCAAEIRALANVPPGPKPPPRGTGREVA